MLSKSFPTAAAESLAGAGWRSIDAGAASDCRELERAWFPDGRAAAAARRRRRSRDGVCLGFAVVAAVDRRDRHRRRATRSPAAPNTLSPGTEIGGVDVGGMTVGHARARARAQGGPACERPGRLRRERRRPGRSGRTSSASRRTGAPRSTAAHSEGRRLRGRPRLPPARAAASSPSDVTPKARAYDAAVAYKVELLADAIDRRARNAKLVRHGLQLDIVGGRPGAMLRPATRRSA